MTRINLKLGRFAASEWIFKAKQTISYFSKRDVLLSRRWRPPVLLCSAIILMQFCAVNAAGQLSIIVVEKNKQKVPLPTKEVTRILGTKRGPAQEITVIPMRLEVGDELVGNTGAVTVKLRCNSAEAALSGKFSVRMLPSSAPACSLYFKGMGARLNMTASGPTSVVSGAFTLGSRRTRYEVIGNSKEGLLGLASREATPTVLVYEDEVVVESPLLSGAVNVKEGQKLVAKGLDANAIRKLDPKDYRFAAGIFAGLDASQANVANKKELEAAYLKLLGLYAAVLENPRDQSKLTALTRAQQDLGIPASGPAVQQPPSLNEENLNPNQKRVVAVPINNSCHSVITYHLDLNNTPFVRLDSPADITVNPGGTGKWQIEYDATGLKPGTYSGQIEVFCLNCVNPCVYPPRLFRVSLKVL